LSLSSPFFPYTTLFRSVVGLLLVLVLLRLHAREVELDLGRQRLDELVRDDPALVAREDRRALVARVLELLLAERRGHLAHRVAADRKSTRLNSSHVAIS